MKPQRKQEENGMQVAELKFLRAQVTDLRTKLGMTERPAATGEARVAVKPEIKVDLKTIGAQRAALLDLVVAVENYFGPEKGVEKPKLSPELRSALDIAGKLVKREKKP